MRKTALLTLLIFTLAVRAQVCDSIVPTFTVSFAGLNAGTTWTSPSVSKAGYCCTVSGLEKCIHFIVTIDSNTAALVITECGSQLPIGTSYYQIDCGPMIPLGDTGIISAGVHDVTYCKPGNGMGPYCISSLTHGMVSVAERNKPAKIIHLAPDPFNTSATFTFNGPVPATCCLEIYDATGRSLRKDLIRDQQTTIERGTLNAGMYYYLLRGDNGPVDNGKFIIE
jgi:hypothetical protein